MYPLTRTLGDTHSHSQYFGEEKKLLPLIGMKPRFLDHLSFSLVTVINYFILTLYFSYQNDMKTMFQIHKLPQHEF